LSPTLWKSLLLEAVRELTTTRQRDIPMLQSTSQFGYLPKNKVVYFIPYICSETIGIVRSRTKAMEFLYAVKM
jgi:hypothetical protein